MAQLAAGNRASGFALPDQSGHIVTLGDLCAGTDRGVIVYSYPKACTPRRTEEACDFRDSLEAFEAIGYAVIGIPPNLENAQVKFSDCHDPPFPLLPDADRTVMGAWDVWGERKDYGRVYIGVTHSTTVVVPDGNVALAQYNMRTTGHVKRLRVVLGVD